VITSVVLTCRGGDTGGLEGSDIEADAEDNDVKLSTIAIVSSI